MRAHLKKYGGDSGILTTMHIKNNQKELQQEPKSGSTNTGTRADPRRNPRIVIGSLDYFEMLMEQEEQG